MLFVCDLSMLMFSNALSLRPRWSRSWLQMQSWQQYSAWQRKWKHVLFKKGFLSQSHNLLLNLVLCLRLVNTIFYTHYTIRPSIFLSIWPHQMVDNELRSIIYFYLCGITFITKVIFFQLSIQIHIPIRYSTTIVQLLKGNLTVGTLFVVTNFNKAFASKYIKLQK